LIYNVLCCVREVTFPSLHPVFCQVSCLQDVAVYVSFQKVSVTFY
ncbi:hypothetical protein T02_13963, partial [Trichinella nativa]